MLTTVQFGTSVFGQHAASLQRIKTGLRGLQADPREQLASKAAMKRVRRFSGRHQTSEALKQLAFREAERRERVLAAVAQAKAHGFDALYHGTKHADEIASEQALLSNLGRICFSRSPLKAAFYAVGTAVEWGAKGAILVLDGDKLRSRYKIVPVGRSWGRPSHWNHMEEWILDQDVEDISRFLISVVTEPADWAAFTKRAQVFL